MPKHTTDPFKSLRSYYWPPLRSLKQPGKKELLRTAERYAKEGDYATAAELLRLAHD